MAQNNKKFEKDISPSTTGTSDEMRNQILEEHTKKYPEGDPSVRRTLPDKGTIGSTPKKEKDRAANK